MTTATKSRTNRNAKPASTSQTRRRAVVIGAGAALIAVVAILVTVTRGGTSSAPTAASARDLGTIVSQKGLGCEDFKAVAAPAQAGAAAGDLGQCTSGGQTLDMAVFTSAKTRDEGILARLKGCIARRAFNTHTGLTLNYLVGPNWMIASPAAETLTSINRSLHADVRQSPC